MAQIPLPVLSAVDAENALAALVQPLRNPSSDQSNALTESRLQSISNVLRLAGATSWSRTPRIYSTLRIINKAHLVDAFISEGLSDTSLPFSLQTLPEALRDPSARSQFIEAQKLVLTKGLDLEREAGRHRHFSDANEIPFSKLAELGKGGYGFVDRVLSTISYREHARKLIPRGRTFKKDKKILQDFEAELATLKKLRHDHIVRVIGSYTDPKFVEIIMSPVADCNLREYLETAPLPVAKSSILRTFFGCLATALCYLHDNCIRHKDVKPQNILIYGHRVLLTDFGQSLDWSELQHSTTTGDTVKTPRYCAPEVADLSARNSSSDIWSLGCVFCEMWTVLNGETLSSLDAHLRQNGSGLTFYHANTTAMDLWFSMISSSGSSPLVEMPRTWIKQMLQENPHERFTARMLCEHIQEVNEDPDIPVSFLGTCCIADNESMASANSITENNLTFQKQELTSQLPGSIFPLAVNDIRVKVASPISEKSTRTEPSAAITVSDEILTSKVLSSYHRLPKSMLISLNTRFDLDSMPDCVVRYEQLDQPKRRISGAYCLSFPVFSKKRECFPLSLIPSSKLLYSSPHAIPVNRKNNRIN